MSPKIVKEEIEAQWNAAAAVWNTSALADLYADDALFFGLLPDHYVGREAIERYFAHYKPSLQGVALDLVEQELRHVAPDLIVAQGFGNIRNVRSSGEVVPNRVRTSLLMAKVGEDWRILLHHFSQVPTTY